MGKEILICAGSFLLLFSGCASAYKSYSSGQIGCMEKDIEVTDLDQGVYNETWVATCKGKTRYICSRTGQPGSFTKQVSCKKEES